MDQFRDDGRRSKRKDLAGHFCRRGGRGDGLATTTQQLSTPLLTSSPPIHPQRRTQSIIVIVDLLLVGKTRLSTWSVQHLHSPPSVSRNSQVPTFLELD